MIQYIDFFTLFIAATIGFLFFLSWTSSFVFGKFLGKLSWKFSVLVFLLLTLSAFILALAEQFFYVTSFWDGILLGTIFYLGILLPFSLISKMRKTSSWKIFFLEQIGFLLILLLMSGILAG